MNSVPAPALRVEFRRSGGFAGVPMTTTVDADQLTEDHAARLRTLLAAGDAPTPPAASAPDAAGADRFQYQLSVEDGEQHRAYTWDETAIPDSVRPLIAALTRLSRPAPTTK